MEKAANSSRCLRSAGVRDEWATGRILLVSPLMGTYWEELISHPARVQAALLGGPAPGHCPAHGLVQPLLGHGDDTLRMGLLLAARLVLLMVGLVGRLGPCLLRGLRPPLRRGVFPGRARRLRLTPSPREENP